jgi:hypothetical protein
MARRHYWIAGTLITLAGFVALGAYLVRPDPPKSGVIWANVERIEIGMTQAEVEAVVGRPPQTWTRGPTPISENSPAGYHTVLLWSDTECDILVYLDAHGRVIGREGVGGARPSWFDRLRRRLGL